MALTSQSGRPNSQRRMMAPIKCMIGYQLLAIGRLPVQLTPDIALISKPYARFAYVVKSYPEHRRSMRLGCYGVTGDESLGRQPGVGQMSQERD